MIQSAGAMGTSAAAAKPPSLRLRCVLISCGIGSILVAAALLAVTLTVYRVREPVMTMNAISLKDPAAAAAYSSSPSTPPPLLTLTVVADVSVRNPNAASLRYGATETSVYYRARRVGEARGPPGTAPARRTVRMNVTVDVAVGALLRDPAFLGDVAAGGAVEVATATRVRGRVAVLGGLVRRRVVLEMNCTATIAVADMSISDQSCEQRVWLQ
ncbi:hypothetical protein SEVIR_1G009500v4 [Setaria viridis]|uniref:Late embryogenesis abundant protein LEA-2 subgroup domain-containing protein n=2 Tax=Setaria TaxID=4554 RepID=K3YYU9_SETIT|nr:uncharacterized protein LOC101785145 [Setaria italica]XP_034596614.1 uncharacterized protein LOC117857814 [Setaria viridis]RCV04544.1 hypothetical protein SETIT_1G009300v2 [Setaria italica]TKW36865.1 hypothetical protein SEVIR_1G009500v2 [Setaria viridis]